MSYLFQYPVSIVFKPGSIQDSGSEFWPAYQVLTESIPIFKKIQNGIVLVKKQKKKSTDYNRVLPGHRVDRVTPNYNFFYFFIIPIRF